jgi:hypothetical protein
MNTPNAIEAKLFFPVCGLANPSEELLNVQQ